VHPWLPPVQTNRRNPHRRTGTDATQARSTSDLSSSALTSRGVGLTRSRLTHRHRPRLDPRPNIFVRRIAHACGHVCRSDIYALILCISSSHICLEKRWFPQETLYTVNLHELLLYYRLSPFFSFFHTLALRDRTDQTPRSWYTQDATHWLNGLSQPTQGAFQLTYPTRSGRTSHSTQSTAVATAAAATAVHSRAALSVAAT